MVAVIWHGISDLLYNIPAKEEKEMIDEENAKI